MKLVWLTRARQELSDAIDTIADENASAARSVHRRILDCIDHLVTFPNAGRVGSVTGTREVIVPDYPYVVVYRVAERQVQILHVYHTSRQWPT